MNHDPLSGVPPEFVEAQIESRPWIFILIALFLIPAIVYLVRKFLGHTAAAPSEPERADEGPRERAEAVSIKEAPAAAPPSLQATRGTPLAAVPRAVAAPVRGPHVPEDAVLRRHFVAELHRLAESTLGAAPTDSVLARHHAQRIASLVEAGYRDPARAAALAAHHEDCRRSEAPSLTAPAVAVAASPSARPEAQATRTEPGAKPEAVASGELPPIPEDSVLRRHFIGQIRLMLQTVRGADPEDSVLKRHHQQLLDCEYEQCLKDQARLRQLLADYDHLRSCCVAQP